MIPEDEYAQCDFIVSDPVVSYRETVTWLWLATAYGLPRFGVWGLGFWVQGLMGRLSL